MDLIKKLEELRTQEQALTWQGTFADYFDIVKAKPQVAQLSHARIFDMITSAGMEEGKGGLPHYNFFDGEIFGLDKALQQVVEYFSSGAQRLEVRKRILLLMGPVGGGKSTIVALLKRGLEAYSRTEQGAVYAIADCPMHEEPLHLIPMELRNDFMREYGIYIEGDLCPHCRFALEHTYEGHIERVPVRRIAISEKKRLGIGTFMPSDPKSQDVSELTGSMDLSTIGEYGSESDPRAYRFDGELNIANRGLMEFVEMLKCLRGDALVFTSQGIRRVDSFASHEHPANTSRNIDVLVASEVGVESATHLYHAGIKPTKRISTQRGYVTEGALEHRFLMVNNDGVQVWRSHDEIRVGDWMVMQRGQNVWGSGIKFDWEPTRRFGKSISVPEYMTPEMARLLGYLTAEGDTRPDGAVRFSNVEEELRDDFCSIVTGLFGLRLQRYAKTIQVSSVMLLDLLSYLGFQTGAYNKEIPWSVLQSSRECMVEFLRGYFAGDGSVGMHGRLFWATASERLASQLQTVLLDLGVVSRRFTTLQKTSADAPLKPYQTVLVDGGDADRLASIMNIIPLRKRMIYEQRSVRQARYERTDVIPNVAHYWQQMSDDLQCVVIAEARAAGAQTYRSRNGAHQILGGDYFNLQRV
jgi:hypothetical protein